MRTVRLYSQITFVVAAVGCSGNAPTDEGVMSEAVAVDAPVPRDREPSAASNKPMAPGASEKPAAESNKGSGTRAEGGAGQSGEVAQAGAMSASAGGTGGAETAVSKATPAADSGGEYSFLQCAGAMPPAERSDSDFPACDGEIKCGGAAHCIPLDRLKMNLRETLIERTPDCTGGKCVPDAIANAGSIQFSTCMGDLGEGRCIPQCFALWVEPFSAIFERGAFGCGSQEVCAPCTHPATGQPSSACQSDMCGAGTAK